MAVTLLSLADLNLLVLNIIRSEWNEIVVTVRCMGNDGVVIAGVCTLREIGLFHLAFCVVTTEDA